MDQFDLRELFEEEPETIVKPSTFVPECPGAPKKKPNPNPIAPNSRLTGKLQPVNLEKKYFNNM
jgi:hypothetical protein